jgi:uncharacterized protein YjdB
MAAIPVGSIQQFIAVGINSDGSTQNVTQLCTWASSNPSVATVTNDGQATSVAVGTASIVATTQANFFPYLLGRSISGAMTLLVLP